MKFIKIATILLSLIALLTGAMDVIVGVAGQANIGVGAAAAAPIDPILDSQVRFLGAVWFGLGAIQLVCLRDMHRFGGILQLCFVIVVLGGIGRAMSLLQVGYPTSGIGSTFITFALVIELAVVPLAWAMLRKMTLVGERK
ncbi:DUF4345 domain-containing protein [Sphingorhabdus contaminans]|uniref:DUF4345 domain-containing protein n=1 Tax=Sphingorhabdus contaminans TaxID=1343899 RepID=A0A553WCK3_9SPHN|nr:DUF4345 domain-containing protein [Sphingorhabdus contaminans]TSB02372.1 DUF4345 domain-containing protein [Sphingorhabdus contaminans]